MKPAELEEKIKGLTLEESLALIDKEFPGTAAFSTSFGLEDQVITHAIYSQNLGIRIFTLDTGRLFNETYELHKRTNGMYGKKIETYYPEREQVEKLVNEKGPDSFYDSVDNRKECCHIRKVVPLNRALKGVELWITGIRSEQSGERGSLPKVELDESRNILKFHPILDWTWEETKAYIAANSIPYNPLHDKGFPSIGCSPCTRAISPGEDFRAGRWWWENESAKECGLHWVDGKLVRKKGSQA
ncbi:phosphoadenosine phosphosulfate reductase [Leptospira perolatii]|uniref:Adenosine 5'-phosphosulfate reductase n=1 Tax=Leptospira perolatii TaxID=2023191 RepID=A0A2M9ZRM5_9LEPT|nr:phosphoadenylyl-sulfate reductase [Leptospira perolatii]PJZ71161.1 phosphoadenosine phosphosulfate reductase [Leptospira perolatii]PJZ74694.1 phosphoadenosine phosphosulfate reductase [Leptospira perolatii]